MSTKRVLTIIFALLFVFVGTVEIQALTQEQRDLIKSGIRWYDPDATNLQGGLGCGQGASLDLIGNSNVEKAFTFLVQKGLTEPQAAGVVGNLLAESGVIPNRKQGAGMQLISSASEITAGTGYGIAQWTTAGRQAAWKAFANERSADALDLGLELEFLWHELTVTLPEFAGYNYLIQTQDAYTAAWIFVSFFERPRSVIDAGKVADPIPPTSGGAFSVAEERGGMAETILATFGGQNLAPQTGGVCYLDTNLPLFEANGVRVDRSPPWYSDGRTCSGTFLPGAAELKAYIESVWKPPVTGIGGYACRSINGNDGVTSIHALGRALDIYIDATKPDTLAVGDEIRNWLINNSPALGVQRVIWNEYTWSSDKDGWRVYGGRHNHKNHIHVELNEDGANRLTPFFQ